MQTVTLGFEPGTWFLQATYCLVMIVVYIINCITVNSHSLLMMFWHKAFIKIMKFVRDYIFECLHYSQDSNILMFES